MVWRYAINTKFFPTQKLHFRREKALSCFENKLSGVFDTVIEYIFKVFIACFALENKRKRFF